MDANSFTVAFDYPSERPNQNTERKTLTLTLRDAPDRYTTEEFFDEVLQQIRTLSKKEGFGQIKNQIEVSRAAMLFFFRKDEPELIPGKKYETGDAWTSYEVEEYHCPGTGAKWTALEGHGSGYYGYSGSRYTYQSKDSEISFHSNRNLNSGFGSRF